MTDPSLSIWNDPNVKSAIKRGRTLDDIAVLTCPECCEMGYYNQGSHFTCRFCDSTYYVAASDEEDIDPERPTIRLEYILTLRDVEESESDAIQDPNQEEGDDDE